MKTYLLTCLLIFCAFCSITSLEAQESEPLPTDRLPTEFSPSTADSPPVDNQINPFIEGLEPSGRESDSFQTKFFNMLFLLALLIGFMMLASWALKKLMKTRMSQLNESSLIKLQESRSISPKSQIHLIEVAGHHLVIAESHNGVTYLTTLPEENSKEPLFHPTPYSNPG